MSSQAQPIVSQCFQVGHPPNTVASTNVTNCTITSIEQVQPIVLSAHPDIHESSIPISSSISETSQQEDSHSNLVLEIPEDYR